ncbi:hypothetical protein [Treponema denticola]|uniref:hypothetical protein n=1 Tax=Treponema denticola TaxID=158 RepID=UPI0002B52C84|nr:hypothetical protein [Treponema denticola]EMB45063.1 hypothetical protein HMPREF9730_01578 [Treponema denticola AL-2]
MIRLRISHFDKLQREKLLKVFISFSDKRNMNSPDFFYVIKNVVLSPIVIGVTIVCGLILSFIFYVMSYKKKPRRFAIKKKQPKPIKEKTPDSKEEAEDEERGVQ